MRWRRMRRGIGGCAAAHAQTTRGDGRCGRFDTGERRSGRAICGTAILTPPSTRRSSRSEQVKARLDWLEAQINEHGEIHLHDGDHPRGTGLGLRPGYLRRTLREAIDSAMGSLAKDAEAQ